MLYFRPTATELLKHPIFKKAKDKKYLQSTLIAIGPSLETRVQKVNFPYSNIIFPSFYGLVLCSLLHYVISCRTNNNLLISLN